MQFFRNKKSIIVNQNKNTDERVIPDTREDKSAPKTLEELRKQSRDIIPRFSVYPFTVLWFDDYVVPYTMKEDDIKDYLTGDMVAYNCGMLALAWKGSEKSFKIMRDELKSKDYYRRRSALRHMTFHDLFEKNLDVIGEAVLDGHELIVRAALQLIEWYNATGLQEEVIMAMQCWPDNDEIQDFCKRILEGYGIDTARIEEENKQGYDERKMENLVYESASQTIVEDRMGDERYYEQYLRIIRNYYSFYTDDDAKKLIRELTEEGCGYASLATTMMQHFAKNQDIFRMIFGYDAMFLEKYVTDFLMLDFYCMTDEIGRGMTISQMNDRFGKYCKYYNINVEIKVFDDIREKQFDECSEDGYIIVFASRFLMYYKKFQPSKVDGWHMMNVCDMEEDVMTVISWGRKYTLNKRDIHGRVQYVYVRYV